MILVRETTVWDDVKRQPNHTYLMSDSMEKAFGYFKWNNPMRIDRRYRTFKVIQKGIKDL